MNVKTLRSQYCRDIASLTAAQVISLHLFLHRPLGPSMDPLFGPYISVLPRNFDSHPLTWLVQRDRLKNHNSRFARLLDQLTPSVTQSLNAAARKFWGDWEAVHACIVCLTSEFRLRSTLLMLTRIRLQIPEPLCNGVDLIHLLLTFAMQPQS
jgi:hypothetical protein